MLLLAVSFLSFDPARRLLFLKGVLTRCDLLGKFGVVGFLPLLPLHGWLGPGRLSPHSRVARVKKWRVRCAGGNVLLM